MNYNNMEVAEQAQSMQLDSTEHMVEGGMAGLHETEVAEVHSSTHRVGRMGLANAVDKTAVQTVVQTAEEQMVVVVR